MYSQDHYTPLYAASAEGFNDVVKSLIAANADVNCVCKVCKLLDEDKLLLSVVIKNFKTYVRTLNVTQTHVTIQFLSNAAKCPLENNLFFLALDV